MVISIGAAAFWIAVAAVLISGGYFQFRRERLRQETLLRLVERTGQLDEQQIKAVFPPPPPMPAHVWGPPEYPDGRRILKVFGTVALSIAIGLGIFFSILFNMGNLGQQEDAIWGFGWSALLACFGVGLFVAARFVRPPIKTQHVERETA